MKLSVCFVSRHGSHGNRLGEKLREKPVYLQLVGQCTSSLAFLFAQTFFTFSYLSLSLSCSGETAKLVTKMATLRAQSVCPLLYLRFLSDPILKYMSDLIVSEEISRHFNVFSFEIHM